METREAPEHKLQENNGVLDVMITIAENLRTAAAAPILAGAVALAITYLMPPTYTAVARILPPAQQQNMSALLAAQLGSLAGLGGSGLVKNPADQYVALLKSRSVYDAVIQRFNLKQV